MYKTHLLFRSVLLGAATATVLLFATIGQAPRESGMESAASVNPSVLAAQVMGDESPPSDEPVENDGTGDGNDGSGGDGSDGSNGSGGDGSGGGWGWGGIQDGNGDSSGSFAGCEEYARRFPSEMNVQQWGEIFVRETREMIDRVLQEPRGGENCREAAQTATAELVHITQQYECALIRASAVGTTRSSANLATRNQESKGESFITSLDLLNDVQAETMEIRQSLNVSGNMMRYGLHLTSNHCDPKISVTIAPEILLPLMRLIEDSTKKIVDEAKAGADATKESIGEGADRIQGSIREGVDTTRELLRESVEVLLEQQRGQQQQEENWHEETRQNWEWVRNAFEALSQE